MTNRKSTPKYQPLASEVASQDIELKKAKKWVKFLYERLSVEYKHRPSAFMSALSEDGELKRLLRD